MSLAIRRERSEPPVRGQSALCGFIANGRRDASTRTQKRKNAPTVRSTTKSKRHFHRAWGGHSWSSTLEVRPLEFDHKYAGCSRDFKASAIVSAVTASEDPAIMPTKSQKRMIMANSIPPHCESRKLSDPSRRVNCQMRQGTTLSKTKPFHVVTARQLA
jgi:hypothetical protein